MAIRMRRGQLADFDPTKQLSGEFGVSIDNSAGNQKVFMAFGNGNVKELMTVEDAEAQIGELVDDAVDAAIGDIVDTVTEAAETATTKAGEAASSASSASTDASSASTDATSAAGSAASADDSAEDSEAWAVGQRDGQDVPATDETYHNNAKYWAEQASQAAGGGVTSFNGRSGSVSPKSGDYTAAMVGLGNVDNTSDLNKPISTATQTALNGKADTTALTDGSVTKIGTGNVGSATQPVYINGGVPTAVAGVSVPQNLPTITDLNDAPVGWANFAWTATNSPFNFWGNVLTMKADSNYWQQIAFPWSEQTKNLAYRVKDKGTWGAWGVVGAGITTGTPTNINSYLTATRTEVHKSGNVVHVNLKFTILSGWSNTASTQICKLPWLPTTSYPWLSRMAGPSTDSSDHYMSSAYIDTTGYICLGEGPYTGLTAGNSIWVYGTYLTNA